MIYIQGFVSSGYGVNGIGAHVSIKKYNNLFSNTKSTYIFPFMIWDSHNWL